MKPDSLDSTYGYVDLTSSEEILQYYDQRMRLAELEEIAKRERNNSVYAPADIPASSLDTYSAAEAGWYQSASGDLYHYDGIIWDEVPARGLKLEFLGE
jgi:hypothetical protein